MSIHAQPLMKTQPLYAQNVLVHCWCMFCTVPSLFIWHLASTPPWIYYKRCKLCTQTYSSSPSLSHTTLSFCSWGQLGIHLARQVSPSGGRVRSNLLTLDTDLGQGLVWRSLKDSCEEKVDTTWPTALKRGWPLTDNTCYRAYALKLSWNWGAQPIFF